MHDHKASRVPHASYHRLKEQPRTPFTLNRSQAGACADESLHDHAWCLAHSRMLNLIAPITRCMQPSQPVKPHAAPTHHDHGGAFEDAQPHPMHAAEPASQASCRTHPSTHPSIHPSSRAQVERAGIDGSLVDDVIVGCVSQTGAQAGNIGRNMVLASVKAKPRSITHPSPLPSPFLHLTVTRCAQLVTRNAAKVQWHMLHWCGSVFARQPPFAKKHHPGLTIHV
jgi:hypothetical protein